MNALLNSLMCGNTATYDELGKLSLFLVDQLHSSLRVTDSIAVLECKIDCTGAFPGIFCKIRSNCNVNPFQFNWCGLLSLSGYDSDNETWSISAYVYLFMFLDNRRVFSDSGSLIRLVLRETAGKWEWISEGWVLDDYNEFTHITEQFQKN